MTDLEIRIAIAKACGWKQDWRNVGASHEKVEVWLDPDLGVWTTRLNDGWFPMPDYLNDLNAMREAVLAAKWGWKQKQAFLNYLGRFRQRGEAIYCPWSADYVRAYRLVTTTAAQQAEAFLRTIGKWEDKTCS